MRYFARVGEQEWEFRFERRGGKLYAVERDGESVIDLAMVGDGNAFSLLIDGRSHDVLIDRGDGGCVVQMGAERIRVVVQDEREKAAQAVAGARRSGRQEVRAVMPGVVVEVLVATGDEVTEGQTLVVLEAMKMQNPLVAGGAGCVVAVHVVERQTVASGDLLLELE